MPCLVASGLCRFLFLHSFLLFCCDQMKVPQLLSISRFPVGWPEALFGFSSQHPSLSQLCSSDLGSRQKLKRDKRQRARGPCDPDTQWKYRAKRRSLVPTIWRKRQGRVQLEKAGALRRKAKRASGQPTGNLEIEGS